MDAGKKDAEIKRILKSMGLNKGGIDAVFLHVLEAVTAISKYTFSDYQDIPKCNIFWKTLREIADLEIVKKSKEDEHIFKEKSPFERVLEAFPDKEKVKDGRMWLPMHFAVTVPTIDLTDILIFLDHNPESIKQQCQKGDNLTASHLAVMMENPNMRLIRGLKVLDPGFAARVTSDGRTPLHLAAEHSNSVAVIQELIRVYPAALEMRDRSENTPLSRTLRNDTPAAPEILQAIVDAAPQTAQAVGKRGALPLHQVSYYDNCDNFACAEKMASILLAAFPDAVCIRDEYGRLPIETAAGRTNTQVLKVIMEATPVHLSRTSKLAHRAVLGTWGTCFCLDNLLYIHSVMPELLLAVDDRNRTPLQCALIRPREVTSIQVLASLAPDAARIVDVDGNNVLHTHIKSFEFQRDSIEVDKLRLLLRLLPGGALATNAQGQTPYDLLNPDDPKYYFARRLLLLAGAPSTSHPGILKQMNFDVRKEGLLAFFGTRGEDHSSGRVDICYRIRHGTGAMELIRQIVSFL